MARAKKKKKYRAFWTFVKIQLLLLVLVLAGVFYYLFGGYGKEVQEMKTEANRLVRASSEETFCANQTSIVYAADQTVISMLKGEKESYYLKIEDIPIEAAAAIVSIEDKRFYRHKGVDYKALLRAGKAMLENGKITQGGSTITMQLARNIFISQEKTWQRKVEETFIALDLEEKYTKEQILEFYLNNIYFGNGYYGLQSASRGYFNRNASELDLSQLAFLCAIPNNPTLYDPFTNKDNTISRRNRILSNMLEDGKISERDYAGAVVEEIVLEPPEEVQKNDYVETYAYSCAIRAFMEKDGFKFQYNFDSDKQKEDYLQSYAAQYEISQKELYTGGYQIYTSLNLKLQEELQAAVDETLQDFSEVNDEGVYTLQAAATCINNDTGYVSAIVGGRSQNFYGYTLNRAYQSFRQPGSAIKPLSVYTPSLERNYTPESIVVDEPIEDGPKNANGRYVGEVTLRTAVEQSINTVAWKMYGELTPQTGLSYLKEMNFSKISAEDYRLASALGGFTNGVSTVEMAAGYSTIENDGVYTQPTCIVKILDAEGTEIYVNKRQSKTIYKQNACRTMTDILKGVLTTGTGKGLALKTMPSAGKTGTTNDQKDGWFVGYTRYYTTSVWVGYDMPKKLDGLMGSTYPGSIWKIFMEKAHDGLEPLEFLPYAKLSEELLTPESQSEEAIEVPGNEDEDDAQNDAQN